MKKLPTVGGGDPPPPTPPPPPRSLRSLANIAPPNKIFWLIPPLAAPPPHFEKRSAGPVIYLVNLVLERFDLIKHS